MKSHIALIWMLLATLALWSHDASASTPVADGQHTVAFREVRYDDPAPGLVILSGNPVTLGVTLPEHAGIRRAAKCGTISQAIFYRDSFGVVSGLACPLLERGSSNE